MPSYTYMSHSVLPSVTSTGSTTLATPTLSGTSYTYSTASAPSPWATIGATGTNTGLQVHGDANFEGDVKIKGKSIADSLERIEERLAILRPNEELEEKWDKLRGLRQMYMELEAEIKEKEKMWAILKK